MESKIYIQESLPDPEKLYTQAVNEHPEYLDFSQDEIKQLISDSVREINQLEMIGERDRRMIKTPAEVLKNVSVIWIISGPGTYDKPTKEDKYKDLLWAREMDRNRLNHGVLLARKIAESRSGLNLKRPLGNIIETKSRIKEMIRTFGPEIVYNGTQLENDTVLDVLSREGIVIPEEKVHIIRGDIKITLDQVKTFRLPVNIQGNEELAIVSHAPHLARIMHMINKNRPFPEGTKVRLFPVPTPQDGKVEYATKEILGLLSYIYLRNESTVKSYPYLVTSIPG